MRNVTLADQLVANATKEESPRAFVFLLSTSRIMRADMVNCRLKNGSTFYE